jgi:hypothetical protein
VKSNYFLAPVPRSGRDVYKFLQSYERGEEDLKISGERAHYSAEFCRLDRLRMECDLAAFTDLKQGLITKEDLNVLEKEKEVALNLSQIPFWAKK